MNKAVFLDRDGTLNVEKHYLYKIEDFEYLPGVIEALQILQKNSYKLIIITNQSGLARGYFREKDYQKLTNWLISDLLSKGVTISGIYYCPHHPEASVPKFRQNCSCRKPKLGMYERAIKELDIDISRSYAIGDRIRDCAICSTTTCKGFLIGENEGLELLTAVKDGQYRNVIYRNSLLDCAKTICRGS